MKSDTKLILGVLGSGCTSAALLFVTGAIGLWVLDLQRVEETLKGEKAGLVQEKNSLNEDVKRVKVLKSRIAELRAQ